MLGRDIHLFIYLFTQQKFTVSNCRKFNAHNAVDIHVGTGDTAAEKIDKVTDLCLSSGTDMVDKKANTQRL